MPSCFETSSSSTFRGIRSCFETTLGGESLAVCWLRACLGQPGLAADTRCLLAASLPGPHASSLSGCVSPAPWSPAELRIPGVTEPRTPGSPRSLAWECSPHHARILSPLLGRAGLALALVAALFFFCCDHVFESCVFELLRTPGASQGLRF